MWSAIVALLVEMFRFLKLKAEQAAAADDQELGELRQKERQREADADTLDRVRRARPDSVSDDEAFGG